MVKNYESFIYMTRIIIVFIVSTLLRMVSADTINLDSATTGLLAVLIGYFVFLVFMSRHFLDSKIKKQSFIISSLALIVLVIVSFFIVQNTKFENYHLMIGILIAFGVNMLSDKLFPISKV